MWDPQPEIVPMELVVWASSRRRTRRRTMDIDVVCNFRRCRKRLNNYAWVTSCSHVFCNEDGAREFEKALKCPACETVLSGKFEVIRVELNPSEQYKSMVLAGQRPEVILDICTRAVSFWSYQIHQEMMYQELVSTRNKERLSQLEQYYNQVVNKKQLETLSLRKQLESTKKELDSQKKRYNDLSEKFSEKNRQLQKLQAMYDALRRKCISPALFEKDKPPEPSRFSSFGVPMSTIANLLHPPSNGTNSAANQNSGHQQKFCFQPTNIPAGQNKEQPFFLNNLAAQMTPVEARFTLNLQTPHNENYQTGSHANGRHQ